MVLNFVFSTIAHKQFGRLPQIMQRRITLKFKKIAKGDIFSRHLKFREPFFVEEFGQKRVVYSIIQTTGTVLFIGDHKEYETYLRKK